MFPDGVEFFLFVHLPRRDFSFREVFITRKDLTNNERMYLELAESSGTYDEYVFRCEVANVPPKGAYEYLVNHWSHVLVEDSQRKGEFSLYGIES